MAASGERHGGQDPMIGAADIPRRDTVAGRALRSVRVDCAGVVFGFPASDPRWRAALRRRFGGFLTDAPASFTITRGADAGDRPAPASGAFGALIDPVARTADLPTTATAREVGGLVRSLLPGLVVDGLVAHAAVLLEGDRGFLCCGQSGAGKSTLARLAGSRRGSDELGAARRLDGAWNVATLPFWNARAGAARLEGVFLLRHAPGNERRRLSPAAALPAVGRHLLWPEDRPEAAQRTVDLLADLVERVPVWDLGFVPTTAAWALIAAPPLGGPPR
jgi:hypothetical protein